MATMTVTTMKVTRVKKKKVDNSDDDDSSDSEEESSESEDDDNEEDDEQSENEDALLVADMDDGQGSVDSPALLTDHFSGPDDIEQHGHLSDICTDDGAQPMTERMIHTLRRSGRIADEQHRLVSKHGRYRYVELRRSR